MKILFVENHSIFADQVIRCFLSAHQGTVVPGLAVARNKLAVETYDVLLVDYDLDDGKGAELVQEVRMNGSAVRIIGVSAREEGNEALTQAGADAVCSKHNFDRIQSFI